MTSPSDWCPTWPWTPLASEQRLRNFHVIISGIRWKTEQLVIYILTTTVNNLDLSNKSSFFFSNPGIPAHCSATAADLKHGMGRNNNWGLRLLRQQLELFGTWKAPVAFGTKDLHIERWHNTEWSMVMSFWSPEISDFPLSPHTTSGGWGSPQPKPQVWDKLFLWKRMRNPYFLKRYGLCIDWKKYWMWLK